MARDEELPENVDLDSEGIPRLEGALPDRIRPDDQPALLVDVVEEPPGAVNRDTDSYTGEKI